MFIARRGFSKVSEVKNAAAAAQVASRAKEQVPAQRSAQPSSHELKSTKLPNDLFVVSRDDGTQLARVSVAVKAGARYEPKELPGLIHALRNAAPLATKHCTAFGLVRNLEQLGASLRAVTTRDHTIYNLDCPRENLNDALRFLAYVATSPEFRHWEVKDASERMRVDMELYKNSPQIQLIEHLHKAAYRGGLANSLYAQPFAYKHLNSSMLSNFVKQTFSTSRMSVAGVGINQERLVSFAEDYLKFESGHKKWHEVDIGEPAVTFEATDGSSRYIGGEHFHDTVDPLAYGALVTEGAGMKDPQQFLTLGVLRELLGTEPHIKWSDGVSPLSKAANSATKKPVAISALNISHSDTGLFGFTVVAPGKEIGNVMRAAVEVMKGKSGVDDKRLQVAKSRLIAAILMADEKAGDVAQDLAVQGLNNGNILTATDAVAMVEKINMDHLVNVAKIVTSGKPTLAGVGNLSHFPRLSDLLG